MCQLTYLLQYSLGGNSKTLMFVMASPLETHLSETLTSMKFATKVHNTHIGKLTPPTQPVQTIEILTSLTGTAKKSTRTS